MRIHAEITTGTKGTSWVIKNRDDVTICRSPKKYKNRDEAMAALDLFMDVYGKATHGKPREKAG